MDTFCRQFNANYTWVADAAFYSADKIKKYGAVDWISRVPESIKAAKAADQLKQQGKYCTFE